jgi:glycosyltransferase involved in cell wall biosynthesis
MRIGIAGPISAESIARFLKGDAKNLPRGYTGAPLLGTLIGALLERGHSVFAYTTSAGLPLSERFSATGDRFKITFCPARLRAFRYSEGLWGRAADAFKHERAALSQAMLDDAPDLVHAHWTYEFALAAIESGLPHVITCHDAPQVVLRYSPNLYRLVRYFMARRVLNQAQCLTAVSPYLKQKLDRYARVPITVVPNPLPPHPPQLAERSRQFDPAHPCIAMVLNGWGARKNPQPALRAFAALRRQFPAAELSIMGIDYGVGGKAESWARSKGLADGVEFIGPQPYLTLLAKLAESDLLLHPALEETFGMSIAEAMSLGVPVVGGEASGAVPWVIGEGGVVTDVTSDAAIEKAMVSLLSDSVKYQCHSQSARSRVQENFSAERVAASYESIYLDVLRGEKTVREERLLA